jgi:uncharacterized membrane protein YphA (DoxX/SURF4 family)
MGLAAVFVGAAVPKIAAPDLFAWNVHNYQILPPWGVNSLALFLPWFELILGVFLALGWWTRACALSIAALMVVFMAAFASATARGLNVSCGCFEVGEGHEPPPLASVILRDLAFLLLAVALLRFPWAPGLWGLGHRLLGERKARRPKPARHEAQVG